MNEFELSRRLTGARPDLPHRGDPLSPAAEVTMRAVVSGAVAPKPHARRRTPMALSIAAAVAVLLAVTIGMLVVPRPSAVYASASPPLLQPTPIEGTAEELLTHLSTSLKPAGGPSDASGTPGPTTITTQSWARSMLVGDDGEIEKSTIEPERRTVEHSPDGSRIEVRRGEPYDSDGRPIHVDGYQVGELVWAEEFGPGEFPYFYGEPPTTAAEFGPFLSLPTGGTELTTGAYLTELTNLLGERRLTTEQTAAALGFLATLPDLEVEGAVVDRLGRPGISFATATRPPGEFVDRIIVSDEGLGILSSETTYVGHDREDVQAPSVWSYVAWE
ncbi:hypothetical protein [Agromyces sp. NPDC058110]|uniref:hypothetical protein n=1 Tax=Agromyces sp. NPDC058110 TaxID=3346345 RepID=UPI0036D9C870